MCLPEVAWPKRGVFSVFDFFILDVHPVLGCIHFIHKSSSQEHWSSTSTKTCRSLKVSFFRLRKLHRDLKLKLAKVELYYYTQFEHNFRILAHHRRFEWFRALNWICLLVKIARQYWIEFNHCRALFSPRFSNNWLSVYETTLSDLWTLCPFF